MTSNMTHDLPLIMTEANGCQNNHLFVIHKRQGIMALSHEVAEHFCMTSCSSIAYWCFIIIRIYNCRSSAITQQLNYFLVTSFRSVVYGSPATL